MDINKIIMESGNLEYPELVGKVYKNFIYELEMAKIEFTDGSSFLNLLKPLPGTKGLIKSFDNDLVENDEIASASLRQTYSESFSGVTDAEAILTLRSVKGTTLDVGWRVQSEVTRIVELDSHLSQPNGKN